MDANALAPEPLVSLLAALVMLLFAWGAAGLGSGVFGRWTKDLDPACRLGVSGLLGLGLLGTVALFVGLIPGSAKFVGPLLFVIVVFASPWSARLLSVFKGAAKPSGIEWLAVAALALAFLLAFILILAPSTANDWDSIAYHMALPKLYLATGQVARARFSSHSAFPEAVELLFLLPLKWGAQSGAKAVLLAYSSFGVLALFGLARERYGRAAGWWTSVAFAGTPVVLWESASAYIDVAHGLFAGLAIVFALRSALEKRSDWVLAGLLLGFACGTKYTGLQTAAVLTVLLVVLAARKRIEGGWKPVATVAVVALAIGGPWYVKNFVTTGNPVYPFLYERFGGVDWDQKRSDIYREEQLSFGVGVTPDHKDWSQVGHAIFGLAYQPGRYVNPLQSIGGGNPLGAVGLSVFAGLLFWALARPPGPLEGGLLAFVGISLVLWFALSQQSRYATTLAIPACLMVGAAATAAGVGRVVSGVVALQAAYTLFLFKTELVDGALPVAVGKVAPADYLHSELPFTEAADAINALPEGSKVALYDQVFGYYLNKPYFWANPGHSSMIPYDSMHGGGDYLAALRQLGFTHVYIQLVDKATDGSFTAALGPQQVPLPPELETEWRSKWTAVWKLYLIEAVRSGDITPVQGFRGGVLFAIKP